MAKGKPKCKKQTVHFVKPLAMARYTVKKLVNRTEPEVGTHIPKTEVQKLIDDPTVEVVVTER